MAEELETSSPAAEEMKPLVREPTFFGTKSEKEVFGDMNTPATLIAWLRENIGEEFDKHASSFEKHKIDGRAFNRMTEEAVWKVVPNAMVGEVFRIWSAKNSFSRHLRIHRRNKVIVSGRALIEPANMEATYTLTHSALKVVYNFTLVTKKEKTTYTAAKTYQDNIDLSVVEDVDVKSDIVDIETITGGCCGFGTTIECSNIERSRVYLSLRVSQTTVQESVQTTESINRSRSKFLSLAFTTKEEGEQLQRALVDAIEEVQMEDNAQRS